MHMTWRSWGVPGLLLTLAAMAQGPLETIDMPQGGRIVYGTVQGADSQGAAMVAVLRMMHQNCGERPQIGQAFRMRGTDGVGLFFTVINHPAGNVPVAGLIIAAGSGPHKTEAALLSDSAIRFGSTINPMLTRLFSVWHPSGLPGPAPAARESAPSPQAAPAAGPSSAAARLHTVAASDDSVRLGIPDGWVMLPNSGHGTIIVKGPQGEVLALNMMRNAVDPSSQWQRRFRQNGGSPPPGSIVYPYHGNLVKAFPELFQQWRRAGGQGPAPLQIDSIEPMQSGQGQECVHVKGQMDPDGRGMQSMNDMMCAILPLDFGGYTVTLHHCLLPTALAEREKDTVTAMIASWKLNAEVINRQMAEAAQQKAASDQAILAQGQQAVANIKAIGERARIRNDAVQAANDAQHAGYWARQDTNARNGQGFTNYQRDQTVVRDVEDPNTHVTVWNQTAGWLERAFPNRIEEVPVSQYIKGQDF